jgi:hypothetical protein
MGWIVARRLAVLALVFIAVYGAARLTTWWSEPPTATQLDRAAVGEVSAAADTARIQPANAPNGSSSANDAAFYAAAFVTLIVGAGWLLSRSGQVGPGPDGSWSARDAHYGAAMFAAYHTSGHVTGPPDCDVSSGFGGDCGGSF